MQAIKSIAEGIPHDNTQHIDQILHSDFLNALPVDLPKAVQIRRTTLSLITNFAEWISHNKNTLLPSLDYIVSALTVPDLSQPAAKAIRGLCDNCRIDLVEYIPSFAGLIRELEGRIQVSLSA